MNQIDYIGDEIVYPSVLPNWDLIELINIPEDKKNKYTISGIKITKDCFLLKYKGLPIYVFDMPPVPKPNLQTSSVKDWDDHRKVHYHYSQRLISNALVGYYLVEPCVAAGFDFIQDNFICWLLNKLYESWHEGKTGWHKSSN